MDRIRNNRVLCFLVALFLIMGMMPMTGSVFAAGEPDQADDSLVGQEITRISITADLHLLGNGVQNNRDRFEVYLKGIQDFDPELLILCGDQFEKVYAPPMEGDYSSEAGIGLDFTNPYDEIRAITNFYLPGVEVVFTRGNNDYNTGNDYDQYAGFESTPINYFGLVKTDYVDVFQFGAPNGDDPDFNYSNDQIAALNDYLANRSDKSKLVLVAGHYPIDDGINTPTNSQSHLDINDRTFRNAGNATSVSAILEMYDQPVLFLWSHNHDNGPVLEEHILKTYGTGYYTMNSGAVGYKETMDYTQGINMVLDSSGRLIDFTMTRYDLMGNAEPLYSGVMEFLDVEALPGDGTADKPFEISKEEHLRYLALMVNNGEDYSDVYFRQIDDINLSGENWKPIGKYVSSSSPDDARNREFSGFYDGNGYIISGLTIDQNLIGSSIINKGYGLFGYLTGTVRNLGMTNLNIDVEISGSYNMYAGGIAGYVGYSSDTHKSQGFIENCFVEGSVQATADGRCSAGGLAGYFRMGGIRNSYSVVMAGIQGAENQYDGAGGLVGFRELSSSTDNNIINGFWDITKTDAYGVSYDNITEGLSISGITTDGMKDINFVALLNQNAVSLGEGYALWMSDALAGLNNGYPIHKREVALVSPDIVTVPADTSALANDAQVQVSMTSELSGAGIWYTTDGSDPTISETREAYTTPFTIFTKNTSGEAITLSAVTTDGNDLFSAVTEKKIVFQADSSNTGGNTGGSSGGSSGGSTTPIPEVTPPLEALPLPDITGHWARTGILKAFELGFINGYPDKTFRPNGNITRAEFLTMLVKALNMTSTKATSWEDVDRHWARNQIQIAANNGIAEGFSSTVFGPDQTITREQLAVMLVRGIKLSPATERSTFRDGGDISSWAVNSIDAASQWKLIQGYGDLSFRPQGPATRAEAVEMIIRALAYQESQQFSN